jgi:gliding motility-associated-like protein
MQLFLTASKMIRILTAILCFLSAAAAAQQDNTWYFGQKAGLKFHQQGYLTGSLTNSQMATDEACATVSDSEGNLLFYTNGVTVWNRNHQVMDNGTGLGGNVSSTQTLIVPKPGSATLYNIFTVDAGGGPAGLQYSEVDMDGDGGLGAVTLKNSQLITPTCEKVTTARHENGTDIWIVAHHWGSNSFYAYLLTAAGVNPEPVISSVGNIAAGSVGNSQGYLKISLDATRLVSTGGFADAQLFDFDNATGSISNPFTLTDTSLSYGAEFSPGGTMVFISRSFDDLLYFNLTADDVLATRTVGLAYSGDIHQSHGALQLGPDGRIYLAINSRPKLTVITNPDGIGLSVAEDAIDLQGRVCNMGLPSFKPEIAIITMLVKNPCMDGPPTFEMFTLPEAPDTVSWDFGDGGTSNELNPVHEYAAPGNYEIRTIVVRNGITRYYAQMARITVTPTAQQPQDIVECIEPGEPETALFNLSLQKAPIRGDLSSADFSVTFHASQEQAEQDLNPLPASYTNVTNPQTIYARVSATGVVDSCYAITSFQLVISSPQPIIMPGTYTFCEGESVTITAPGGFDAYQWSTGETTQEITVNQAGSLTLTAGGTALCQSTITIVVTQSDTPEISDIKVTDWTDNQNTITIIAAGTGNYSYSIDRINYQESPTFTNLAPGRYIVYVKDIDGCGMVQEQVLLLMYPKFFTPNGDGENETWRIPFAHLEPAMLVYVFDRYGKLITSFKGSGPGWDGTLNGQKLPATDYWFVVMRQDGKQQKGHFSMMR